MVVVTGVGSGEGAAQPGRDPPPASHSLEHGNEQVEQQNVGEEQVQAEQGDRQPLRENGLVSRSVAFGALGLVWISAIGAAAVQAEVHT